MPSGWLQVIRGPRPPAARWPSAQKGPVPRSPPTKHVVVQQVVPPDAHRRQKPSEVRAAASTRVSRLQGALANLGPDDTEERKALEAALKKAKNQAGVLPVEDQIAMCLKFLERAKKRLALADTELQAAVKKKSQCEQEIAEAKADFAREEHCASGEEPKTEAKQFRARVAQLEEIRSRHVRGSEEAAENIRTKAAKRRVGGCTEDALPSTKQDLACWLDDRQIELRDALGMADMESASVITSLITRGLAKMASFVPLPSALSNMVPWAVRIVLRMDEEARVCGQLFL